MSEYKGIHGGKVQNFTTNPDNPIEGQVWYNETDGNWKVSSISTVGSWATGGSLNTARWGLASAKFGTQNAALAFAGNDDANKTETESYDGTSWTEVNDLNTARNTSTGLGTQTAAIVTGGNPPPAGIINTESWNGTSWTEVNDLNQGRFQISGTGLSTAGLVFGGVYEPSPPTTIITGITESWNGTSWTEVADLNTARYGIGGAGTQTAALAFGGANPAVNNTETWNGTSWTEVNDLNTVRKSTTGAGYTNTEAMSMGGNDGSDVALTELWNGTSWSEDTDLNTARQYLAGAGTTASALAFGGGAPPPTGLTATEEWTGAGSTLIKTITTS